MDGSILVFYVELAIYFALLAVAVGIEGWAFADCIRHNAHAFEAVGKRTKTFWIALTGGSFAVGILSFITYRGGSPFGMLGLFALAAVVAASVYLADVRPAVKDAGRGGSRNRGPYGPW